MILAILLGITSLVSIFLEFFLPGGVMALVGGVFFLVSIAFGVQYDPLFGGIWTVSLLVALLITMKLALVMVKKKSIYLSKTQAGYGAYSYGKEYVGKSGIVVSELRPSGYIEVEGVKCQAISSGAYIKKGVIVKIVGERSSHLVVR
ncbi:MAG: hypothetical protein JSR76_06960 [Verrucomicrobia bacterium]|nr:hypothetical protein [Verrucomicrobiota bacterium]